MPESFLELITRLKAETGLDENRLRELSEQGLHSYWKHGGRFTALSKDDAVALKRAAKQEGLWQS